jgi:L-threonylcarbamoyladenylate synthase
MKTEIIKAEYPNALRHALDILLHGGLVAFPTDTVYGLATLPFQAETVERLYVAKGRSTERAIAVLLGDANDFKQVASEVSPLAMMLAQRFWPGPLTLIVPRLPHLPNVLSSNPTIGVRIPDHPIALSLLRLAGPLAVTSANLSGQANTTTAQEVFGQLKGRIHLIVDGGHSPGGVPSTVVDCTGPEPLLIREGPITLQQMSDLLSQNGRNSNLS